jgi:hypothetical protein
MNSGKGSAMSYLVSDDREAKQMRSQLCSERGSDPVTHTPYLDLLTRQNLPLLTSY